MIRPRQTFRGVVLRQDARTRSGGAGHKAAPAHSPTTRVSVGREVAGRGGKAVTVIRGLQGSAGELEELATRLKRLCGAGGTLKSGVIEIQGDHRDKVVAELGKLGLEAKRSGG
jgi:translation initiation factor 1